MNAPRRRKPKIPLTVVVGHRGAGKTSLVNRLLSDPRFANTAVIVNDSGRTVLENGLVETVSEGVIALGSGCVCCTVRGELVEALERLLRGLDNHRIEAIERVVIEAEQRADPAAILGAVLRHPYISLRFAPDGIIAVARAQRLDGLLASDEVAVTQFAMADLILVSGPDEAAGAPGSGMLALNPRAAIAGLAQIDPSETLGLGFWPDNWRGGVLPARSVADRGSMPPPADQAGQGEAGRIRVFSVGRDRAFAVGALERFSDYVVGLYGPGVVRIEGVSATAQTTTLVRGMGGYFLPPKIIDEALIPGTPGARVVLRVTARDIVPMEFIRHLDSFLDEARIDTPDRAALIDNPLSIAGFSVRPGRS